MRSVRQISAGVFSVAMAASNSQPTQASAVQASRFGPRGMLALKADAYGATFEVSAAGAEVVTGQSPVAVIDVVGPLMHHPNWCFDNYDDIKARVRSALASSAKCVLLSIDSPGGLVAGCFDTVDELRQMSAVAGKRLYAYVDSQSSSAAYALACAAERIFIPATGIVGSIGVIDTLADQTAIDEAMGVRYVIVASGSRKADGNPHVAITDEAIAEAQSKVDAIAAQFWALVSERRGVSVDAVKALQCAELIGQQAIDAGLADEIATLDQVVAMLASAGTETAREGNTQGASTMSGIASVKAALQSVADDDKADEKDREQARKALAAFGSNEDDKEKEAKAKAEAEEKEKEAKAKAEDPPPPPHKEPDEDDKEKASASAVEKSLMALAAQVNELTRDKQLKADADERQTLLASRPDLDSGVAESISALKIEDLRRMCAKPGTAGALPLGPGKAGHVGAARAAIGAAPTIGADVNTAAPTAQLALGSRSDMSGRGREFDEVMGITKPAGEIKMVGNTLQLGVVSPQQARDFIAAKKGGK